MYDLGWTFCLVYCKGFSPYFITMRASTYNDRTSYCPKYSPNKRKRIHFTNPFFLRLAAGFLETFLRLLNGVENNGSYFNCRRQLFRFFKGSLLTAVDGFSSSSSKAAGTGQSGILTGVTGFEELFSPFSSFLWLK